LPTSSHTHTYTDRITYFHYHSIGVYWYY